jgi:hypothetical protein
VPPPPGFPEAGPFNGRDQIRHFYAGLREGWKPDARVILREPVVEREAVADLQWRWLSLATDVGRSVGAQLDDGAGQALPVIGTL